MLLSQVIRNAAITGRTDAVGARILGRQGGQWTQQWIDGAFPQAAARSQHVPPQGRPQPVNIRLDDLRRRGILSADEAERLRSTYGPAGR